jgi:hypothetical protein
LAKGGEVNIYAGIIQRVPRAALGSADDTFLIKGRRNIMKRGLIGFAVLVLALGVTQARAENVVNNYDFLDGFDFWETSYGGPGTFTIEVLEEYEGYQGVLHVMRTGSGNVNGKAWVTQDFDEDPFDCVADSMRISVRCKVVSHTLEDSGWWSTYYGGFGEYPLHFIVYSQDTGTPGGWDYIVWNKALLTAKNSEPLTNYQKIPKNRWVKGNVKVDLDGHSLTGLALLSSGWDFEIYLDYIEIEPIS